MTTNHPQRRWRIAHVNSESQFSGGEQQLFLLMQGLRERGHHNVLFCRPGSQCERAAREHGFEVHTIGLRNNLDFWSTLRLWRAIRRSRAQLVNLHTGCANWLGGWAARMARVPAVTIRRMDRKVRRGLRTRLIYRSLTQATVAISPAVVDCLTQAGVAKGSIALITDAVDPDALQPLRSAAEMREALQIDDNRQVLLALASLDRRKGLDILLTALAELRHHHPDLDPLLLIAGAGPEQEALEQQVASLSLQASVRLLGRRNDAPDLLGLADAFVLPSRREGMGVAALEAMAVGCPVVASRVGGLQITVKDELTGLLVPPEDPQALTEALARLLTDAELRQQMGLQGIEHIGERFHIRNQVDRYEQVYAGLLGQAAQA